MRFAAVSVQVASGLQSGSPRRGAGVLRSPCSSGHSPLASMRSPSKAERQVFQNARVGPKSARECSNWPDGAWEAMQDADAKRMLPPHSLEKLRTLLCSSIDADSAYSGMGGDVMGLHFMTQARRLGKAMVLVAFSLSVGLEVGA